MTLLHSFIYRARHWNSKRDNACLLPTVWIVLDTRRVLSGLLNFNHSPSQTLNSCDVSFLLCEWLVIKLSLSGATVKLHNSLFKNAVWCPFDNTKPDLDSSQPDNFLNDHADCVIPPLKNIWYSILYKISLKLWYNSAKLFIPEMFCSPKKA